MKGKPCELKMNSPLDGYEYIPRKCKSIAEALRIAREYEAPYRIYDMNGNLIKKGWYVQ